MDLDPHSFSLLDPHSFSLLDPEGKNLKIITEKMHGKCYGYGIYCNFMKCFEVNFEQLHDFILSTIFTR